MGTVARSTPDPAAVLAKAVTRAAAALGMNDRALGRVLGVDRTTIGRMRARGRLQPDSKAGELAACLIRIHRGLYALTGGDPQAMRHWMATDNRHLGGRPAERVQSVQGLVQVLDYLDAPRGRA